MVEGSGKHAFWQALIFTIIVFGLGLILGYFLEMNRSSKVEINLINSEINLLDEQVRIRAIQDMNVSCEEAKESTFSFADKIYNEAVLMEEYDATSKFTKITNLLHRRYDLLRMILWIESVETKQKCGHQYHTIAYLYEYETKSVDTRAKQTAFARILEDVKGKYTDQVLLIPMAGNLDVESINIIKKKYGINKLPSIIIDEKHVIDELPTASEVERILFENKE